MFHITKRDLEEYLKHPKVAIWYTLYLSSEDWHNFRDHIIKTRRSRCELCKKRKKPLIVHHLTYINVTKEKPEDVLVVCIECHAECHNHKLIPYAERIYDNTYKIIKRS